MKYLRLLIATLLLIPAALASAENISYKLSLSLAGVSIGAGSGTFSEQPCTYNGADAVKIEMTMSTGRAASILFNLRDTMTSYVTPSGDPIHFSKVLNEGGKHNVETADFTAALNGYHVLFGIRTENGYYEKRDFSSEQVYDMLSMLKYCRTNDSSSLRPGDSFDIPMVNGDIIVVQHIVFLGKEVVKDGTGKKRTCLELSVRDNKLGHERETLKVYVSDDNQHIPVRLDIDLGACIIKAVLNDYKD